MTTKRDSAPNGHVRADRVALLIDTDNIGPSYRHAIAERAYRHGDIVRCMCFGRRVDATWTEEGTLPAVSWGEGCSQTSCGRNAGDIDLAITAVDLLHANEVDTFAIASGDSDFTALARRLRNAGKRVVAIGMEDRTARSFRNSCDAFEPIFRIARPQPGTPARANALGGADRDASTLARDDHSEARAYFLSLVEHAVANFGDGWWTLEALDVQIRRMDPTVRYRDFGKTKLIVLLRTYPDKLEVRATGKRAEVRLRKPLSVRRVRAMKGRAPVRPNETSRDRSSTAGAPES